MPRVLLLLAVLLFASCEDASPPENHTPVDQVTAADLEASGDADFDRIMEIAVEQELHERPIGEIMQTLGLELRGAPYVAGMLDEPDEEELIARLDQFDCVLFIEGLLALARGIQQQDYGYQGYLDRLEEVRYRNADIRGGYCERLHYWSDWIATNERRGVIEAITDDLGGEVLDKEINFMTQNRDSYPRLVASDSLFREMQQVEADLAGMDLYYIPQDRISEVYDQLQAGDIIATATDIEGLDVTHTGLVYKTADGQTGFLHASTSDGVTTAPDLEAYIRGNRVQIGIVVARPLDAR
jgi:hypothetical protein